MIANLEQLRNLAEWKEAEGKYVTASNIIDAIEEIQRLRAEKKLDFSGLWGYLDSLKKQDPRHMNGFASIAQEIEQQLMKMGIARL